VETAYYSAFRDVIYLSGDLQFLLNNVYELFMPTAYFILYLQLHLLYDVAKFVLSYPCKAGRISTILECTASNRSIMTYFCSDCQGIIYVFVLRKVLQIVYHLQEAVYHQTYERGLVALCTCIVHPVILLLYTAQTTKARRSFLLSQALLRVSSNRTARTLV